MKILICFGTRPEAIKMALVIQELKRKNISFKVCITAQHREMLDQVMEFFEIQADYDLDLMKAGQSLNGLSANILSAVDKVFDDWLSTSDFDRSTASRLGQPPGFYMEQTDRHVVLVHGDTTTANMVAQAAFHRQIKIGHVEAGLRTYNKQAPFPEEINRQIISRLADFHFTPTEKARHNLLREGVREENIVLTGNTVVDALDWANQKLEKLTLSKEVEQLQRLFDADKKIILVTGHRRESFGKGLEGICNSLLELAGSGNYQFIYPVHLNPHVKNTVQRILGDRPNIHLVPPVAYSTMLWLMQRAELIISDSGGIQEEAPAFGKPVLVTREVSERMEGVEAGFSFLVGINKEKIVELVKELINDPQDLQGKVNPYGDGKAAGRIVRFLMGV